MGTENQELQRLLNSNQTLTTSSKLNTAIKAIEPKTAIQAISGALLRIGTLYQIPNFNEANALILAEWTVEKYKHKPLALILEALRNPAIVYEEGNITRSWRLTPETVAIWIEQKSIEEEGKRQLEETRKAHAQLNAPSDLSPQVQETIKGYLDKLQEGMFKRGLQKEPSPELKRIDLMLSLLSRYKKENIDPITGKLYPDALPEIDWLLDKGYFIENGEIKEL